MPPTVSGTFLEWGKVPFGTLLRGREEANPIESLLRDDDALWAIAAATRDEWSVPLKALYEKSGEFNSSEASGSFSIADGAKECELSGCSLDSELPKEKKNLKKRKKKKKKPRKDFGDKLYTVIYLKKGENP